MEGQNRLLGGQTAGVEQGGSIPAAEAHPTVYPGVHGIRGIDGGLPRHDQKALPRAESVTFPARFKSAFPLKNAMDKVVVPHGRAKSIAWRAGLLSALVQAEPFTLILMMSRSFHSASSSWLNYTRLQHKIKYLHHAAIAQPAKLR